MSGAVAGILAQRYLGEPPKCVDNSRFVADVTVPDGSEFAANQPFVKKWSLLNPSAEGICPWAAGYNAVWTGGVNLADTASFDVPSARPGERITVEIPMRAPTQAGKYTSVWILRSPRGILFGDRFSAEIVVR